MNNFLNIIHALVEAANGRAMNVLRKQAEIANPSKVEYRSNAGGWN